MKITLDQKQLEKMGSCSLLGIVFEQDPENKDKEIILVFPQTTIEWRQKNNGPDEWIIPEYTFPCLLRDILSLTQRGYKIEIEEFYIY